MTTITYQAAERDDETVSAFLMMVFEYGHAIGLYGLLGSRLKIAMKQVKYSLVNWSIENTCHWSLDAIFGEDASRVRIGHAPQNFALLRRLALTVLKQDTSQASLNQKRFRAALEDDFLLHLLSQF